MTESRQIKVLPTHVANKIAAGEVVDRPASVLKELMENALDAGAERIDVEIVSGGRKLVSVCDNGYGMNRDDALLSIERQATSKIQDVDDIEKITTLGFRGEALAAIASVSRFRLITCSEKSETGTEVRVTGGKVHDVREAGSPVGTLIEVRDLFFNVPARRKFLRTYQTEQAHLRTCFILLALSHPDVGMNLKVDGREMHQLAGKGTLEDRIRDLFGSDYMKRMTLVDYSQSGNSVTGYVSLPAMSRSDRNEQFVFVNGRATGAALINFAINEGYHTLLPDKRQPSVFLFIRTDPGSVDVNVHPTKKEIRFRQPGEIRDLLISAIRKALGVRDKRPEEKPAGIPRPVLHRQMVIENLPKLPEIRYAGLAGLNNAHRKEDKKPAESDRLETDDTVIQGPWQTCRILGQLGDLYVVLETEDGYVIMDPHAAHERVLFEKFMRDILEGRIQSQNLLMPETVELGPQDASRVRKNLKLFEQMGFGISEFGGDSFVVDALPSYFADTSAVSLINEIAHSLELAGKRGGTERWREESVAQAACKTAVKSRDRLSLSEMEKLVAELAACEMPYTCPHGRPTMIYTPFQELHRKFNRE